MEKSFFFDAQLQNGQPDRVYSAEDIAALRRAYCEDGVLSGDALKVTASSGMTVRLSPGAAVVSGYTYILDTQKSLALTPATSLPRIDVIVLRLDLAARAITPTVIRGEPSVAPATPSHLSSGLKRDLPLAKVAVGSGVTSVSAQDLTDLRHFASEKAMEAPFRALIAEALAESPMLSAAELVCVKSMLGLISTDGTGERVLCDDGHYRLASPLLERVELVRYTEPGEYEFSTAMYPSANGLYDAEVIGAGGAGGSVLRPKARGGGGGAGSAVTVCGIRLPGGSATVTVGEGGCGHSGANGGNGWPSTFGPISADGGYGGMGGTNIAGGSGGQSSPFYGDAGVIGSLDATSSQNPSKCGAGASGPFGNGGKGATNTAVSLGNHASGIGAGGSGAGGDAEMSSLLAGGNGSHGAVIVYGYKVRDGEGSVLSL